VSDPGLERENDAYITGLERRLRALEAALRALTRHAPLDTGYAWGNDACAYCHAQGGEWGDDPEGRSGWRIWHPAHEPDCPWAKAKALLGEGA
jgi:hypothetical protein